MLKNWVLVAVSLASCSALADSNSYPDRNSVRDDRYGDYRGDRRDDRDDDYYYRPESYTCVSTSRGLPFLGSDRLEIMAKTNAIRACQASSSTNNYECANQVECRPDAPQGRRFECTTTSRSLPFAASGNNELEARVGAIRSCQASASTNNQECYNNVQCTMSSHHSHGYNSCMAESRGLIFTSSGKDSATTKIEAIRACQASASTNNQECMTSAVCESVYASPRVSVCTTQSRSIPFALEEQKFRFEVLADVVRQCQNNPSTNNLECRRNVQCESGH